MGSKTEDLRDPFLIVGAVTVRLLNERRAALRRSQESDVEHLSMGLSDRLPPAETSSPCLLGPTPSQSAAHGVQVIGLPSDPGVA